MEVIKNAGSHPLRIWATEIEGSALEQLRKLATLRFVHPHGIAAMADAHTGIGSTVGSVIATQGAIIPAAVGVDIGCGMAAVRLSLRADDLPQNLTAVRRSIERGVPLGAGGRHAKHERIQQMAAFAAQRALPPRLEAITARHPTLAKNRFIEQLGSLGSGNHFIELCLDEEQRVWAMLHSGSRGTGNLIGRYFIERAKRLMERHGVELPDTDLAFFSEGTTEFDDYVDAMHWAQDYALANRDAMMAQVLRDLAHHLPAFTVTEAAINCHHNYASLEHHFDREVYVTRKGAIHAGAGELGIIPGSMGTKSYIVRGKGSADSYHSCSHGAGRRMSRTAARKRFTQADILAQTAGVECRKDMAILDEIPAAYKDIDAVMAAQADLVSVVHTLKQVLCVKGD